jgi:septum formation protein
MQLVLASTSRYRRELLARLGLPFDIASPDVDETPVVGEAPQDTAARLAHAKALAVAGRFPQALIIGSDQVAVLGAEHLDKPGSHARALAQLRAMRGKEVVFHTGVCVLNAANGRSDVRVVPYSVRFRDYTDAQIESYLRREQPYDCTGSAKSEGLGIALIAAMRGEDPNALVGLPLIALTEMLAAHGVQVV